MPKKPSGLIGPLRVDSSGLNWDKIRFPDNKVSQEALITSLFVDAMKRDEGREFEIKALPEADHDARLIEGATETDLQLMEIVFSPKRGSPYRSGIREYDSGYFADRVIERIERKRYDASGRPLWLLLYPTHWAFVPAPAVDFLLHKYLTAKNGPFSRAIVLQPLSVDRADLTTVYPNLTGKRMADFDQNIDEQAARSLRFRLADPDSAVLTSEGLTIKI